MFGRPFGAGIGEVGAIVSSAPGEGHWYGARAVLVDIESGGTKELYSPRDQLGVAAASPSGHYLSVVEATCSDRGFVAGNLRLIDTRSATVARIDTQNVDIACAEWRSNHTLLVAGHRGLDTVVGLCDIESNGFSELWSGREITTGGLYASVSGIGENGDCVLIGEGFFHPPEIALIRGGRYQSVKSFAADVHLRPAPFQANAMSWEAPDGMEIQGWLLRPDREAPHPVVMWIHGGPVWHWRPRWLGRANVPILLLLSRGYAVFLPNPRGSDGRGQAYARGVLGDMGGADTEDFLSGLDALEHRGLADPNRLGVIGVSYGGFMTAWLITQDTRFSAAIAVAPVTNWVSEHLLSNIPDWVSLFLADSYKNLGGRYFQRSPIVHAHKAKTPTLSICGALDRSAPPAEATQFHRALLENGTKSVLVTYPEEGHGVRKFPATIDYAARVVSWFEEYMQGMPRIAARNKT